MPLGRRLSLPLALALLLVTLVPIGAGIADAASARWVANCDLNIRSRPTTLSTIRVRIAKGTSVTTSGTVTGGAYMTNCPGSVSGSDWLAITTIGGRSVKSLYGVMTVYAASRLFHKVAGTVTAGTASWGRIYGIDISQWNGRVDFAKVRGAGKRFVIARATAGRLITDSAYAHNRAGALAAGLAFTAYHFAMPDLTRGDAIKEADHFVAVAKLQKGMLIPALDLETGSWIGRARLRTWVETWLSRVSSRLGVKPMIYTTQAFWTAYVGGTSWFSDHGYHVMWVADWSHSAPRVPDSAWDGHGWTFWQYSDCGSVRGVQHCVDLDQFRGPDLAPVTW